MYKYLILVFLFSITAIADTTLSSLPLNSAPATVGNTDSFPYVKDGISKSTYRLYLKDILGIPAFTNKFALYAPISNPTFTGLVTGNFSGQLSGTVTGNVIGNVSGTASSVTGIVTVSKGGTGTTSGTSGGVLGYTSSGVIGSSGLLTLNQVVVGGGAGALPKVLPAGSQYKSLIMGATIPGYSSVALDQSAAVSGVLQVSNGGTGGLLPISSGGTNNSSLSVSSGAVAYTDGTKISSTAVGTLGQYLKSNGAASPSWGNLSVTPVKTSNYTVSVSDEVVLLSSASGYITVTMYTPVGNAGRIVKLIKYDSSFNQIGISGTGLSTTLATLNEAITLVSDGTNWAITNRYIDSTSRVTTITGSWTTNTTYSGVSWRVGDRLFVQGKVLLTGAPNAVVLSITIPNGLVIDTSKVPGGVGTQMPLGKTLCEDAGVASYGLGTFRYGSTTVLNTLSGTITGSATSLNNNITHATPFTFGNADSVTFQFDVPIAGWGG